MDTYNHLQYGQNLVTLMKLFQYKPDKSYFRAPNSDTLQSISNRLSEINYPVMVAVDGKDSDFSDNEAEVLLEKPQYFFMILLPADNNDPDNIMAVQETAKQNIMQVIARMMYDKRKELNGLGALLIDSFVVRSIGPMGDNLHGVVFGFNVEAGTSYKLNSDFWV